MANHERRLREAAAAVLTASQREALEEEAEFQQRLRAGWKHALSGQDAPAAGALAPVPVHNR